MRFRAGLLLPWTCVTHGYRVDPDRPHDPAGVRVEVTEAAMVAEMVAYYLEASHSLWGLTKHLMTLGVPTPHGQQQWHQPTVGAILSNPVCTGKVYVGRLRSRPARTRYSALRPMGPAGQGYVRTPPEAWTLVAHIPPIVSQEQFELVQAKLAHSQRFAARNNTAHDYLLRALISCGPVSPLVYGPHVPRWLCLLHLSWEAAAQPLLP
jgi:site-specific DNA recombinase